MLMDAFICQVLVIIIVNWFHLDLNSVKSYVYSATYKKIKIRYLKFDHAIVCIVIYVFCLFVFCCDRLTYLYLLILFFPGTVC